ncbi:MAG: NCS2 family permease [Opitutaceae bacterium]|nr:NCS2 family permease [Opitutaceae bacterium]
MLQRWFKLAEHQTTAGREVQAGLTTFAAMAYILVVNPTILANTGMDRGALVTATALSAAVSTVLMALLTNYPLALAPGMGINAYFTFSLCLGQGIPWQDALGMVCINGVIFLALSVTGLREKIVAAIPHQLKIAITCGIGLFIAFIGLKNGGLVVSHPATFVAAGDFGQPGPALCFTGILLMLVLVSRRVPGAIIITVLVIALLGVLVPDGQGGHITTLPSAVVSAPVSPAPVALELRFDFVRDHFWAALPIILTLLFVDMFDNIGTLIGVTKRAGLLQPDGRLPKIGGALLADSSAAILSSLFGTSTVVSYIESAAGVEAGGRTGLTSLTTALLFLVALVFSPLILAVPAVATAPALVVVGIFMMQSALELDLKDFPWAAAAVATMLIMPVTFSISEGIGFGLIVAAILLPANRRAKEMTVLGYVLAAIFLAQFFRGPIGRWLEALS